MKIKKFEADSLYSMPGKFMQGVINDQEFHEWILE